MPIGHVVSRKEFQCQLNGIAHTGCASNVLKLMLINLHLIVQTQTPLCTEIFLYSNFIRNLFQYIQQIV
jgi:hypothetical protein